MPWDQALDIVLQAKGLDKRRSGNVVWIAPQSEIAKYEQDKEDARIAIENRAEMVTEYIPISYGNAEDLAKLLTEEAKSGTSGGGGGGAAGQSRGFLSPRGSISFDRRTNTLLVIDIPQRVEAIKDLVAAARQAGGPGRDRSAHRDRQRILRPRAGRQVRHQRQQQQRRSSTTRVANNVAHSQTPIRQQRANNANSATYRRPGCPLAADADAC